MNRPYKFGDMVTLPNARSWRFMLLHAEKKTKQERRWVAWPIVYVAKDVHDDTVFIREGTMALVDE